ncbi:Teashirt-like protein 3 [Frankliniella fusca]|uniref:Teashirt-like protein 3 n=1 Tax=Frankliniella fusca TaxID=407009 RepID=A0AAE1I1I4_9NEOP|nr:Teashirt-like protein 3 [Frankliniella fusca]KAK3918438.1 Teashirt-like protein 3 [Frankliniella fusca]KAK3919786.1 Teashirt-like protein 3 [Frankliniella fusca]KAK3920724.1 Teashirt-like protein 3 [Frankliniella fusca]KAK3931303.1 Teashirt-like protein 3 [Frankliniella fusca]
MTPKNLYLVFSWHFEGVTSDVFRCT